MCSIWRSEPCRADVLGVAVSSGKPTTDVTRRSIEKSASTLPVGDRQDFDDVTLGFLGRSEQRQIVADDGLAPVDPDFAIVTP
jgi:alkyl sulfatase BDS1-like metallo-beta-lactamase superfamily hydrolase